MLEQCLSGVNMAASIIQKANTRLKILYRKQKFFFNLNQKAFVMSLIQCHFDYA